MGEAVLLISLSRRNSFSMSKSMAISISKSAAASTSISMLNSNGRRHYYLNRDGVTHSFLFFIGEPPQPSPNSLASSSPIPPPISKPSDAPKKSSSNPKPKPPSNWEEDGGIGPLPFIDTSNEAERRWSWFSFSVWRSPRMFSVNGSEGLPFDFAFLDLGSKSSSSSSRPCFELSAESFSRHHSV